MRESLFNDNGDHFGNEDYHVFSMETINLKKQLIMVLLCVDDVAPGLRNKCGRQMRGTT